MYQDPQAALEMPVQLARGRVAATVGAIPDFLNTVRSPMPMEMFGQVDYGPQTQVPYGSQQLLQQLPLAPRGPAQQAAAQLGALVPMTPAEALQAARLVRQAALAGGATVKQAGRLAGEELNAAMMGERPGTLLGAITPQPMYAVPPNDVGVKNVGQGLVKEIPKKTSLLDMTRTPSEAEIKKLSREDLINWLQRNDPSGQYLDPTPNPSFNMYRTARGYNIEDADTGRVFEFGDYNKAKKEFDALRYSDSEFAPMTLQEAQDSALNFLRESVHPVGGAKVLPLNKFLLP